MSEDWDTRPPAIDDTTAHRSRRRSSIRRAVLYTLSASLVIILALVVGLVWLFSRHAREDEAARAFAAKATQEQCVPEALRRLELCKTMACASAESSFLGECLMFAHISPKLCEGVPLEIVGDGTVAWVFRECREVKAPQLYCSLVFGALLGECAYSSRLPPAA